MCASTSKVQKDQTNSTLSENDLIDESVLRLLDEPFDTGINNSKLRNDVKHRGFDPSTGNSWIYPTNYPVRTYQFNITRACLFKNTLVVLPTGLGKTFIAAVVMYNIFRWYPCGKVIFMAPTRPLVGQQIEACYQITGIPKNETAELTGKQKKQSRSAIWHSKRVFFATPQVVWSDMNDPEINFPIDDVKLIVIDEAHKARGKYAYTEVIQSLVGRNKHFRVLALSATPGRNIKDVVEVIQNLLISHVEVRCETSIDVAPFTFKKNIQTKVVKMDDLLRKTRDNFIRLIDPYVRNLMDHRVVSSHTENLSKGWLIMDRKKFQENTLTNRHPEHTTIMSDFSTCISLYHALELLERHGVRVFLNYFDDNSTNAEEKYFVMRDANLRQFLNDLRAEMGPNPFPENDQSFYGNLSVNESRSEINYGHPKFDILRECVTKHFEENPESKSIIFCEFRKSVYLINRMMLESYPTVKPKVFVGQGNAHARTITQKEQIAIMKDFRSGACNTLIATCVAEEGIDVGEVDLIVCFDVNNKNPTRFTQRIGRTGRKRQGKVIMLVTEGKEQYILKEVLATKDGTNQKITKSSEVSNALYRQAPRLIPPEFNPQCIETFVKLDEANESDESEKPTKNSKVKTKAKKSRETKTKQNDVRKFFKPIEIDDEIVENFDIGEKSVISNENDVAEACSMFNRSIKENVIDKNEPVIGERGDRRMVFADKMSIILSRCNELGNKGSSMSSISPIALLCNENIPNNLKIAWLENNLDMVSEHIKHKQTSKLYTTMIKLVGDESNLRKLIFNANANKLKYEKENINIRLMLAVQQSNKINATKAEIQRNGATAKVEQTKLNSSNANDDVRAESQLSIPVCDVNEPIRLSVPLSTPNDRTSSTPIKQQFSQLKTFKSPAHSPIQNSPLLKAFERSRQKMNNGPIQSLKYQHCLNYLGLNSLDDLFDERELSAKIQQQNQKLSTSKREESDLFADDVSFAVPTHLPLTSKPSTSVDQSQYTVSRILRICEADDKSDDEQKMQCDENTSSVSLNNNSSNSTSSAKKLHIGSISDLFRDSDFGCDDDANAAGNESDATVEYDADMNSLAIREHIEAVEVSSSTSSNKENTSNDISMVEKQPPSVRETTSYETNNVSAEDKTECTMSRSRHAFEFQSPSNQLKCAEQKSPSIFQRTHLLKSQKSLLGQFNSTASSSNSTKKLNFSRLQKNDAHIESTATQSTNGSSPVPFLTCREVSAPVQCDKRIENQLLLDDDDDEIFATCPMVEERGTKTKLKSKSKRRKKANGFIDDEAGVSGDDSDDDEYDNDFCTQFECTETDDGDPNVDMHAKYLQSVRSPAVQNRFLIRPPRNVNMSNIFSQVDPPNDSSSYEESFVVNTDDEIVEYEESMCLLEKAELRMKEMRRNKRKIKDAEDGDALKKRRRIIVLDSDSD